MPSVDRNTLSFLALCAIWGTTWIGIKAGVDAVPPLIFASTRFMTASLLLLLLLARWRGERIWRAAAYMMSVRSVPESPS